MRVAILFLVACLSTACTGGVEKAYLPPLWTVPGQKVRHLATNKVGTVREMNGEQVVVDFEDGTLSCEPIKVVPLR